MNKRKDKNVFLVYRLQLGIRKMPYRREWIELEGNQRLQRPLPMKTKIAMRFN